MNVSLHHPNLLSKLPGACEAGGEPRSDITVYGGTISSGNRPLSPIQRQVLANARLCHVGRTQTLLGRPVGGGCPGTGRCMMQLGQHNAGAILTAREDTQTRHLMGDCQIPSTSIVLSVRHRSQQAGPTESSESSPVHCHRLDLAKLWFHVDDMAMLQRGVFVVTDRLPATALPRGHARGSKSPRYSGLPEGRVPVTGFQATPGAPNDTMCSPSVHRSLPISGGGPLPVLAGLRLPVGCGRRQPQTVLHSGFT